MRINELRALILKIVNEVRSRTTYLPTPEDIKIAQGPADEKIKVASSIEAQRPVWSAKSDETFEDQVEELRGTPEFASINAFVNSKYENLSFDQERTQTKSIDEFINSKYENLGEGDNDIEFTSQELLTLYLSLETPGQSVGKLRDQLVEFGLVYAPDPDWSFSTVELRALHPPLTGIDRIDRKSVKELKTKLIDEFAMTFLPREAVKHFRGHLAPVHGDSPHKGNFGGTGTSSGGIGLGIGPGAMGGGARGRVVGRDGRERYKQVGYNWSANDPKNFAFGAGKK